MTKNWKRKFEDKFEVTNTGCFNVTFKARAVGYGSIKHNGKNIGAHRLSYMLANEIDELDKSEFVCHKCDNRLCINPEHLFLGSHSDNMKDAAKKDRIPILRNKPENRRLSRSQAIQVKKLLRKGVSQIEIARKFNVSRHVVYGIASGETYKSDI
jgi:hypothetical protein